MAIRRPAVAGTWYPANAAGLAAVLGDYVRDADSDSRLAPRADADLIALVAPHAGLVYSCPVAAHAYRLLKGRQFDTIILVGPSHYVAFEGASIWRSGAFETPLGNLRIDEGTASAIGAACPMVTDLPAAHAREHSLEMQLPFLASFAPDTPIVPIVMGHQTRATAFALGDAIASAVGSRRALIVASSDLSHFYDAPTAAALDATVVRHVDTLDPDGLMTALELRPDHACGGGPIVSVLRAAKQMGATTGRVLRYADSGDVSGDKSSVVGYLAAALWR
jgi:MEMO1 family protein